MMTDLTDMAYGVLHYGYASQSWLFFDLKRLSLAVLLFIKGAFK